MKGWIYKIEVIPTGKIYIGQTVHLKNRIVQHKNSLKRGSHFNRYIQHCFNKYGEDNFSFSILEEYEFGVHPPEYIREFLTCCEISFILKLNPELNIASNVRDSTLGRKFSDEEKKRFSESRKGRVVTAEQRAKISASLKGREGHAKGIKQSPEWIEKAKTMRKQKAQERGFFFSEEHRANLSKANTGKKSKRGD